MVLGLSWNSHCSSSVKGMSLSSCSKSLTHVASESCSLFADSSSIAWSSSVISCIKAAVCLAFSFIWLHSVTEGLVVVFGVLRGIFFPLPTGLVFPLSGISFVVPMLIL